MLPDGQTTIRDLQYNDKHMRCDIYQIVCDILLFEINRPIVNLNYVHCDYCYFIIENRSNIFIFCESRGVCEEFPCNISIVKCNIALLYIYK